MPPCHTSASQSSPKGKSKAKSSAESAPPASWSDNDVHFLIDQVIARKAEAGDGLNFKKSFWQSISSSPELAHPAKGGPKTRNACKEKWSRLGKTFDAVDLLAHASGFAYSLELGANIGIENETVWVEYIKRNPGASPFRNKGWPFYDKMMLLGPSKSKGKNRFPLHSTDTVDPSTSASQPPLTSKDLSHSSRNSSGLDSSGNCEPEDDTGVDTMGPAVAPFSANTSMATSSLVTMPALSQSHAPSTPSHFTPPTAPSSFASSLTSSIKPSSSISVRAESIRKRKANDDDISMVSAVSRSAIGSTFSLMHKRRAPSIPAVVENVGNQLKSMEDTFREGSAAVGTAISNLSLRSRLPPPSIVPTDSLIKDATTKLLSLDISVLSPEQTAAVIDCFRKDVSCAEMYLTLASDTSDRYVAVRKAWLMKRLEEAQATR